VRGLGNKALSPTGQSDRLSGRSPEVGCTFGHLRESGFDSLPVDVFPQCLGGSGDTARFSELMVTMIGHYFAVQTFSALERQ